MIKQSKSTLPITVIPGGSMWFPWAQADPTELCLTAGILTDHVITASVLLNSGSTSWAFLNIHHDEI